MGESRLGLRINESGNETRDFEMSAISDRNQLGGDETRSGYMRCVQGIQHNVSAHTTCRHGLYNSLVHAHS